MSIFKSNSKQLCKWKKSLFVACLPKFTLNYVVIVVVGYWATKEVCGNVNFMTDTKVKTLSFLQHIKHKMDRLRAKFENSCG